MKKLLVPAILVLGLIIVGCPKSGPTDYTPLAVGDTSEFAVTSIVSTTTYLPDTTTKVDTVKSTTASAIVGTTTLANGQSGFVVVSTTKKDTTTTVDTSYAYKSTDSLYAYNNKTDTVPGYVEPLVLAVGTTWVQKLDTTSTITYKVEADTANVTVPFGTYSNCLMISQTISPMPQNTTQTIYTYRTGDVGVVKTTSNMTVDMPAVMKMVTSTESDLTKSVKK